MSVKIKDGEVVIVDAGPETQYTAKMYLFSRKLSKLAQEFNSMSPSPLAKGKNSAKTKAYNILKQANNLIVDYVDAIDPGDPTK